MIAYIDESKDKQYLFVLNVVSPKSLPMLRKALAGQLLAGQRSIHFRKESSRRRIKLIRILLSLDFRLIVFKTNRSPPSEARNSLIQVVCENTKKFAITDLVFELDQLSLESDITQLNKLRPEVQWDHRQRHQEPLLWVADAVAWCVNRGGEWERLVRPMIVETIDC